MPSATEPAEFSTDGPWIRRLFFALVLLYLVPLWTVHYLPTVDGPCHTYNAWVIRSYSEVPLFQKHYEINPRPYPNWMGHGVTALLMFVAPPLVAEKLMVTLYVVLLLSGVWYLAGSVAAGQRWLAFLVFPFVYNAMFQYGFYNFSLGFALFPWIVGFWWRRRERVDLRYALGMNLLLGLCFLSHIVAFVVAMISIAVLWVATLRPGNWRRHLLHVVALAPQLIPPLWYLFGRSAAETVLPTRLTRAFLVQYLLELRVLAVGDPQRSSAIALSVIFLGLAGVTVWWMNFRGKTRPAFREADAFPLLALVLTVIYLFSPDGMGGGGLLKPRLSLFPFLVLIPWLAPPLSKRARGLCAGGLALMFLLNLGYVFVIYQVTSRTMASYLAGLAPVRPNTRLLPLFFRRESPVLGHASGYAALEKNLIDWNNFEATGDHFPTIFRASAPPPPYEAIERRPGALDMEIWKNRADYVYTWGLPQGHPFVGRLAEHYNLISVVNDGALWELRE